MPISVSAAVTFPALLNAWHENVATAFGALRGVVTRDTRLRNVGSMIEAGPGHPVLREPDRRDLPLIESAGSHHVCDIVTVDADAPLEQLASHLQ